VLLKEMGDISTIIMGTSPPGSTYNVEQIGMPLLNGPTEFGQHHPNCTLFTTDSKRECEKGDIIFCVRGSTTGRINWADKKYSLGRGVCCIRGKTDPDTKYIKYCIDHYLPALLQIAGGATTFPNLRKDDIHKFKIPYPESRHKIAAILSAYDDLIENNTRRIKILEEMAQALYREWFVEFRFPGHEDVAMVDAGDGRMVPEGWDLVKLGDKIELAYGKALRAAERKNGDYPVYGSSGVIGWHDVALAQGPGIIVGRKGNVGSVYWSDIDFHAIDTVYYVKTELPLHYVYFNLQHQNFIDNDAAVPGLNRNQAYSLPLLIPEESILGKFGKMMPDLFAINRVIEQKNANLKQTRDLLLPRLIEGEIDVADLEINVNERNF
jgi:type I restriction enzyme S subunit